MANKQSRKLRKLQAREQKQKNGAVFPKHRFIKK